MALGVYRFKEFEAFDKLYPSGIYNDMDTIKTSLKTMYEGTILNLKKEVDSMKQEMKQDVVIDNEVIYSNVDILDFYSSSNAINIVYNSMFISLHSFLETRLRFMCKLIESRSSIKLNDISGKGIYKYRKYLEKVHQVNFDSQKNNWELICHYSLLRNKLTHSQTNEINVISEKTEFNKLKKLDHLTIIESNNFAKYKIDNIELIEGFLRVVSNFLEYVCIKRCNYRGEEIE